MQSHTAQPLMDAIKTLKDVWTGLKDTKEK